MMFENQVVIVTGAVLKQFGGNDPARFQSIRARFSQPVFPGETVITEM